MIIAITLFITLFIIGCLAPDPYLAEEEAEIEACLKEIQEYESKLYWNLNSNATPKVDSVSTHQDQPNTHP